MIKKLIEDLTFDRISLSQALTRAKIIAYKINNDAFKDWLAGEIKGYSKRELPDYRIISCDIFAEIFVPFNGTRTIPLDVTAIKDWGGNYSFNEMRVTKSIGTLEMGGSKDGKNGFGYEYFPVELTNKLKALTPEGDSITAFKRRVQLSQINYILEQTKQRLLDTLLELNDSFPELENDFSATENNHQKIQNIITQHIYGPHSNSNIGIGEKIQLTIDSGLKIENLVDDLKKLGVPEEDTDKLEEIVRGKKDSVAKKLLAWVGNLSTKAVEKGIELQIPVIIEKVGSYI